MKEMLKLYNDDCINIMNNIDESYIDLTVTSPPYDNLREYNNSLKWDWNTFKCVAKELYRITKEGGIVVWVVNDATINGSETGTSFKQALFFKDVGFNLHDTMIYAKNNYMPLNHNRYDPAFEFMFVLSKGKPKTFNPLMVECKTAGAFYNYHGRSSGSTKEIKSAMRKRNKQMITKDMKYRGNIWFYDTGKYKGSKDDIWVHPATFPEKLAEDHILSWSNKNDIVFDPFMGSGTTGKMALINSRKFIGIEIVKEYYDLAKKRLSRFEKLHDLIEI